MRLKTKKYAKLAVTSLIAAFSFGLAISCVSNHKQNINKVFAEESDGTWTLTDGSLKFQYTDWQSNGYVTQTNQIMVHGNGDGTFDISYQLLGDPPGATTASTETLAEKTIQLTGGYWTPSETGGYGTVSGFPVDVNGLDSGTMITLNINVQYSGNMNEQGSGEGDDENAGTWTWNENTEKLSFQFNDTAAAGYVSTTSQTMVHGNGNGTFDIGYDLYGTPANATMASNDLLASKTIRLYDGYFNENTATVTGNSSEVAGLESYGQITVKVDVTPSGDLNADGWRVNDGDLYFYVLDEVNPASIDSITWNNSSGNGTGEAILSVTISTNGGSFQQVYQINNPTFNPELEGTSGTTLGNTTVEGISEWSDLPVIIDISNKSYSLGESTQEIRYTITYYPNGADGEPSTFKRETSLVEGDSGYVSYEFEQQPENYTRSGYSFVGWSIDSNAEEAEYLPNVSYSVNQDLEVFAVWVKVSQEYPFEVLFAANDGTEKTQTVNFTCPDESTVFEFPSIDEIGFERENYRFLGWSTESDGEVISDSPTIPSGLTTFYAIWELEEQVITYTISYYPNGGQGEPFTRSTDPVEGDVVDVTYTFEGQPEDFINGNLRFEGWSTDEAALEAEYTPYESYTINENKVVYAVWVDDSQISDEYSYEILFVANDGTDNTQRITFTAPSETTSYELPSITNIGFERVNYTFVGWSSESDGEIISGNPEIETGLSTFYAIWEYDDTPVTEEYPYEVVFNANGGSGTMETDSFTKTTETFEYSLPQTCGFTYPEHEFIGWSLTSDGDIISGATVISSGTTSIYAIWRSHYSYTVRFDGNDATSGSTESVILSGDDYSQTIVLPECGYKKEGYEFVGWGFTSDAPMSMTYQPGTERTDITADTTFYAIWVETFTISFDANGGEGTMENITIPKGNAKMPECGFTREGYSFAGWAVGSPTGDVYPTGENVYVSANYVLFATWEAITPITEVEISVAESEVILYVDDTYIIQYTVTPKDAAGELIWEVEDEKVASVIEDGMLAGLNVGSTTVTISDRSGNTSVSFVVYVVEKPVPVQPENPISEETIENISNAMDNMELSEEQTEKIQNVISENQEYISDEAGDIIYQALLGTTISSDDPVVAEAQKELVVAVVEAGVAVDAGKATNISGAQTIDKALPENANFSVEGEIQEFYERQMAELFGGEKPTRSLSRAGTPTHGIDTDTKGKEGQEAVDYLANEQLLYKKMGDFVESGVDHMGKAALKLRKCSGEAVTVQVKSYVTRVKVSSFREFDKEAADKEFVEAAYKAILLSMQNEVISILEKEHKPSNNAEKEAQYTKELEAVKDIESFEIMVTEVLRQKYVALTGENIEDVDAFHPIYWEIFSAWALDKASPYPITLEELTQTTIEQSTSRARAFTINSDLTGGEWGFIAGIIAGSAAVITAAAVIPTVLKKRRAKEGNK